MTEKLKDMLLDYKDDGGRVDEVLFQEVTKVVDSAQKADELLRKLHREMGKGPDEDMGLWLEIKSYVKSGESD